MKRWNGKKVFGAVLMLLVAKVPPALAQTDNNVAAAPSLKSCLTRVPGAPKQPVFPRELLLRREQAEIDVTLKFKNGEDPPEVVFDKKLEMRDFILAVRAFAAGYRLPCMPKDAAPVTLRQQFSFAPGEGQKLISLPPSDPRDAERERQIQCIVHTEKKTAPKYPWHAARNNYEENVPVRLRFVDPARAPEVIFLAKPLESTFGEEIEEFAKGLRMPCLAGEPVEYDRLFPFRIYANKVVLRDMSLVELVSAGKDYATPANFDFAEMACPFDVRVTYMRPYMPNRLQELGNSHPARRPLLEWMSKITFQLDDKALRPMLGLKFNVRVPCGKLDL